MRFIHPHFCHGMRGFGCRPGRLQRRKGRVLDDDIEQAVEMVGDTTVTCLDTHGEPSMPRALRMEMSNRATCPVRRR